MNALNIFPSNHFISFDIRILIESEVSIIKRPVYFMKSLIFCRNYWAILCFFTLWLLATLNNIFPSDIKRFAHLENLENYSKEENENQLQLCCSYVATFSFLGLFSSFSLNMGVYGKSLTQVVSYILLFPTLHDIMSIFYAINSFL